MGDETGFAAEGGCTCGGVRYRLTAPPLFVHCCHCTWCQRASGSAFATNILIETARVTVLSGATVRTTAPSPSGRGQAFLRCPGCGVTLWSHYLRMGEHIAFVRAGTLEDPSVAPPDIHIYTSTKQPWVTLPDGVPAVPEYYRADEMWPADSLARFAGALR
ncbi:MAG: GFA family protein [Alphaproteobacteria bacterium]